MILNNRLDDNFMKEGIDIRRFGLCLLRRIWIIVLVVALGAIIGFVSYKAYYALTDGKTKYEISNDYYIVFNEQEYPNGMDYFNAYTWSQFIVDDKIVDYALSQGEGLFTKNDIYESVSTLMPSDYRVLSVIVTNADIDKMNAISEAYKSAMPHFAKEINELLSIELWSCGESTVANIHDKVINATILGAIIAFVIAAFGYAIYYCMDDRIYVENDWNRYVGQVPFIGYESDTFANDTKANQRAIVGDKKVAICRNISEACNAQDAEGIILLIPWGKAHSTAIGYDLGVLKKQGINVLGIRLTDCSESFLKAYYGRR